MLKYDIIHEFEALAETLHTLRHVKAAAGNNTMPVMGYHHFKEKKKWISGENIDIQSVSTAAH